MSIIPLNKCSDVIIFRKTLKELSMMSPVGNVIEVKNPGHLTELEIRAKTVWESMGMSQDLSQEIKFAIAVFIRKNDHLLPYLDIKEMQELLKLPGMKREDLPVDTILHASNGDVKANLVALRMIPCFAGEAVEQMARIGEERTLDVDLRQVSDAETLNLFLDYQCYGAESLSRLSPEQLTKLFDLAVYFDQDDLRKNIVTKIANLDVEKNMNFLVDFIIKLVSVNKGKIADIVQVFQNHKNILEAVSEIIQRPSYIFDQNGRAQLFLGHCLWIDQNAEIGEIYNCFGLSAKQGNLEAQELLLKLVQKEATGAKFELGQCYLEGKGVEKNEKEGLRLLHLAAKKEGNVFAERAKGVLGRYYLDLGCCYLEGKDVEKNEKEIEPKVLSKVIEQIGLSKEEVQKDFVQRVNDFLKENPKNARAETLLELARKEGIGETGESLFLLGWEYNNQGEVGRPKAFSLFTRAAEQGHLGAQNQVGILYHCGIPDFLAVDKQKAVNYFKLAVQQSYAPAQRNLGILYLARNGENVLPRNTVEAFKLFKLSADQNDEHACHELGVCYLEGIGTDENRAAAIASFRKGADRSQECKDKLAYLEYISLRNRRNLQVIYGASFDSQ